MLDELIKVQEDFSSSIVTAEAVLNIAYVLEEEFADYTVTVVKIRDKNGTKAFIPRG